MGLDRKLIATLLVMAGTAMLAGGVVAEFVSVPIAVAAAGAAIVGFALTGVDVGDHR